mmetsp:Transcript_14935/g.44765  ORF Transcript_14935/g.44765 Transcript_14935/m.44765 type:complete len:260 (-) Transcript_14935:379-1158(-)
MRVSTEGWRRPSIGAAAVTTTTSTVAAVAAATSVPTTAAATTPKGPRSVEHSRWQFGAGQETRDEYVVTRHRRQMEGRAHAQWPLQWLQTGNGRLERHTRQHRIGQWQRKEGLSLAGSFGRDLNAEIECGRGRRLRGGRCRRGGCGQILVLGRHHRSTVFLIRLLLVPLSAGGLQFLLRVHRLGEVRVVVVVVVVVNTAGRTEMSIQRADAGRPREVLEVVCVVCVVGDHVVVLDEPLEHVGGAHATGRVHQHRQRRLQ